MRKLPLASIDRAKVASKPKSMKLAPKAPRAQLSGAAPANISSSHPAWRQPGGTAKPQSRYRPLAPTGAPDPRPQFQGLLGFAIFPPIVEPLPQRRDHSRSALRCQPYPPLSPQFTCKHHTSICPVPQQPPSASPLQEDILSSLLLFTWWGVQSWDVWIVVRDGETEGS